MKMTVLEMVQDILSSMDSDEVNSINDTIEAQQVAHVIKNVYNDIVSTIELPEQYELFQLDASGDATKPVVMRRPEAFGNIEWLKYNKEGGAVSGSSPGTNTWTTPDGLTVHFGTDEANWSSGGSTGGDYQQFKDIKYLPRAEFLKLILSFNDNDSTTLKYNLVEQGFTTSLLCRNDKQPEYYTDISNEILLFDSYDASLETTLQSSKTMAYGKKDPVFQLVDTYVPELDDRFFSLLFNESKALCFSELKQVTHQRAEKAARRDWIKTQKAKAAIPYGDLALNSLPNYGRRR